MICDELAVSLGEYPVSLEHVHVRGDAPRLAAFLAAFGQLFIAAHYYCYAPERRSGSCLYAADYYYYHYHYSAPKRRSCSCLYAADFYYCLYHYHAPELLVCRCL